MSICYYPKKSLLTIILLFLPLIASAQIRDWPDDEREGIKIKYTEANVPLYTLPDLLTLSNGEKVRDIKTWNNKRRPEILALLEENQFGKAVGKHEDESFEIYEKETPVFNGKALRKQIILDFGNGVKADHGMYSDEGKSDWGVYLDFMDMHLKEKSQEVVVFPANNAVDVNPDTHLKLTFPDTPVPGNSGTILVYDAADDTLVDILDLSIHAGPTKPTPSPDAVYTTVPYEYVSGKFTNANTRAGTPSGMAQPTPDTFQLTIIGGFTDGFHFHPVIIRDNTAIVYLHNNLLEYGKTYYVQIDPGVLTLRDGTFLGIRDKKTWQFSTKKAPPSPESEKIIVSDDGTGDFNTVQGAMDFIPDYNKKRGTVFIRNGIYEEIVYFRNKSNIFIMGEDREKVIIQYENNEILNPHPINIKTNEAPGTFPSRRAVFAADNSKDIHISNLTIKNTSYGQAEGLLLNGERFIISHVNIIGSGDALQSNGPAYYNDCHIIGDGDTILGRGPAFFEDCEINSYGPYMWIRNTSINHGNVFVDCVFRTRGEGMTVIARNPVNGVKTYTYSEAVLIDCRLSGIDPAGWGEIGGDVSNIRYWEHNSRNLKDETPVDVTKRHPVSRQLTMEKDADIISNYRDPAYVLGGWTPK